MHKSTDDVGPSEFRSKLNLGMLHADVVFQIVVGCHNVRALWDCGLRESYLQMSAHAQYFILLRCSCFV